MKITVPMAPVKFSSTIATASAHALGGWYQSHTKARLESICRRAPSHSAVASGSARATAPPAKPPSSRAARPRPLTMAA